MRNLILIIYNMFIHLFNPTIYPHKVVSELLTYTPGERDYYLEFSISKSYFFFCLTAFSQNTISYINLR